MSGFLLIIFLCALLIWTIRSVRVEPYIIATGGINDQWQIITPGGERPEIKMTAPQAIQESLVWAFVQDWFTISPDTNTNVALWDDTCQRTDCDTTDATNPCKLFCTSNDALFSRFKTDVLPSYEKYAKANEFWTPIANTIRTSPIGNVGDFGGTWRVQMAVSTNNGDTMQIVGYAKVAKDIKAHPKTMGYYIADFNAYRMN